MILGVDVSTYLEQQEIAHSIYTVNGKPVDPLQILYDQGVHYIRTRIWNNPYDEKGKPYLGGTNDVDTYIKLATRLKKYGFKFVADFHYSDFWVDPAKQTCPKDWLNHSFEEVEEKLYKYTKTSLDRIKEAGLDTEYVQIGNEITNGMVWPYGQIDYTVVPRTGYDRLARLLKAGIRAAKEVYPKIKIIIHLERVFDTDIYKEYFSNLAKYGVEYDIVGVSYYPYWHGTFEQLLKTAKMCKEIFNKDMMVMELGYSFTLEDYITSGPNQLVFNKKSLGEQLEKIPEPITPEGQANFVRKFLKFAKENNILGVFYWEPLWVPGEGICWASEEAQKYIKSEAKETRNEWANQCFFDYDHEALPSLFAFSEETIK